MKLEPPPTEKSHYAMGLLRYTGKDAPHEAIGPKGSSYVQ